MGASLGMDQLALKNCSRASLCVSAGITTAVALTLENVLPQNNRSDDVSGDLGCTTVLMLSCFSCLIAESSRDLPSESCLQEARLPRDSVLTKGNRHVFQKLSEV